MGSRRWILPGPLRPELGLAPPEWPLVPAMFLPLFVVFVAGSVGLSLGVAPAKGNPLGGCGADTAICPTANDYNVIDGYGSILKVLVQTGSAVAMPVRW